MKKVLIASVILASLVVSGLMYISNMKVGHGPELQAEQTAEQQGSGEVKKEKGFPDSFEGMDKVQFASGDEALASISELHGKGIKLKNGYIAVYHGADRDMQLWISESETKAEAQELFDVMDQKMSGSQAFSNRQEFTVKGIKAVYVFGMGMANYYYVIDNKVYWAAISGENPQEVLKKVIETF